MENKYPAGAEASPVSPEQSRVENLSQSLADGTYSYLSKIVQIPLLEKQDQLHLGRQARDGRLAAAQLANDFDGLGDQEVMRLISLAKIGNTAKWQLVYHGLRFAAFRARLSGGIVLTPTAPKRRSKPIYRYAEAILPEADRIQAANEGLIEAAGLYDPDFKSPNQSAKFTTYASYRIDRRIIEAIYLEAPHLSVEVIKKGGLFKKREEELSQQLGRSPTLEELVKNLNWDDQTANRVLRSGVYASRMVLGRAYVKSPSDQTESSVEREAFNSEEERLINIDFVARCLDMLDDPRKRQVITLRYGLLDGESWTYEEIAELLGVSIERVRQIEKRALKGIRDGLGLHGPKQFIFGDSL